MTLRPGGRHGMVLPVGDAIADCEVRNPCGWRPNGGSGTGGRDGALVGVGLERRVQADGLVEP
jgi:hypothetical protein